MKSCKYTLDGEPACKLGTLTPNIQLYGDTLACVPTHQPSAPSKHKIMVIAKAPDMRDRMSIGSGRNIEKLMDLCTLATIDPRDIYVTGLVKCAPPKRNPSVQEVKACMGHLADELKAVQPEVVVLMGSDALRAFNLMGQGGVNALHGKVHELAFPHDEEMDEVYNVVVTTDPNALYMNPDPKLEGTMVKDLRVAKAAVEGDLICDTAADTNYKLIENMNDLDWMIGKIQEKGVFAFDTESRGLPWSKEPMICMQFTWGYDPKATEPMTAVLPLYNHDPHGTDWKLKSTWDSHSRGIIHEQLKLIFEDENIPKAAHNIKYDMCVVRKHLDGIIIKGFLFDTMLMHHLLWEHPPHDLEYLSDLELSTGDYSKALHKITGRGRVLKNTYDHVPDDMMWRYGSKDSENTYRLMCLYFPRLQAKPHLWALYQDEVHPFIRTLFKAEWYGCSLSHDVIDTLTKEFEDESATLLTKIKAETWPEFNPSSSAEVAKAITDAGYFKDIEDVRRAKGYSTNKQKLLKLAPKFPLVKDILRFRTLTKLTGTYMSNAKKLANGDGRARIGVMIHGTVNGRVSAPFLHQIPRLDMQRVEKNLGNLRDMFVPKVGSKIVYGDFSQIELVTLAIQSGDKDMLEVFKSGEDIHAATAAAFLDVPLDEVNEFNRSIGKNINFGRVYGSVDGYALMKLSYQDKDGEERPITQAMVNRGFQSLDDRFPAAATYFQDTVAEISAKQGTYITRFGREKHMGSTLNSGSEWMRGEAERQAVNGSIQSPANSVTVRTLNAVDAHLIDLINSGELTEDEIFLIITVHDSGAWETNTDHIEWFVPKLREIAGRKVPQLDDFQFTMKVGVGDSWSEAELNAE